MIRNILLITADDLNADACGCFGCPVEGTTPSIDAFAATGMQLNRAHITIAVCQPSRGAMLTGRYPHRSGIEGFHPTPCSDVPDMIELLRDNGYALGCLGKLSHTSPKPHTQWDMSVDMPDLTQGRSSSDYHENALAFMRESREAGQPFFLAANSHDPHRPFHQSDQQQKMWPDFVAPAPSRVYEPDQIEVPAFLPDLPEVRLELAEYYSSVRRFDDTVGAVLRALDLSGAADETIVLLSTDHGMPLPFAKTNCWAHSTRTPLIVRWPGVTPPGSVDDDHFVSGIDFLPTFFESVGIAPPDGIDGRSFAPVLRGEQQPGRELVFTQFHETAGKKRFPMRAVQNADYLYIFNPWSNGEREFRNESQAGRTFSAMNAAAANDDAIAARVNLFIYREVEELYDMKNDFDCLSNLAADPAHAAALAEMRSELRQWMKHTGDSALDAFDNRDDPAALEAFMADQDARSRQLREQVGA